MFSSKSKRSHRMMAVLLSWMLFVGLSVFAGVHAANPAGNDLFLATDHHGSLEVVVSDAAFVRSCYVDINFSLLSRCAPGDTLGLNLFDDLYFTAVLDERTTDAWGETWVGHLDGIQLSQFILVLGREQVSASIAMPSGIYQVRYAGGVHVIHQIDQALFPPEADPIEVSPDLVTDRPMDTTAPGALHDDGSVIDVLVAYTPLASSAAGGTIGMENLIRLAVEETNQSYQNSAITQRLNLVHMVEVAYTESGNMQTDLGYLSGTADSYMNEVHQLRNTYAADVVSLILESTQYCGMSYMMSFEGSYFQSSAFSVVARVCATGYYSLGHELGHNMGAHHDWYVNSSVSPSTYSHGYVNAADGWRTIMAYNTECTDQGRTCTRLQFWSNPNVYYGGDPMGFSYGTSSSCQTSVFGPRCDADNHRVLNDTADTVANFRVSASSATATPTRTPTLTPALTSTPTPLKTATPTLTPTPSPLPSPASFPIYGGFETGQLGVGWSTQTTAQGRVLVSNAYPYAGSYSVLLDDSVGDTTSSFASLFLTVNLAGQSDVQLDFWWRDFGDEDDAEDGVFISGDYGAHWYSIYPFTGSITTYQHAVIDLDAAAAAHSLALNDHFQIKFQFYDNYPITSDGYAIDEVHLQSAATPTPTWTASPTPHYGALSVLLVDDDDNTPDVRSYYTQALDQLGMGYTVWNTGNSDDEPASANLGLYDVIIWFTGDGYLGNVIGPSSASEAILGSWLDSGGCMLISGQDYVYDRGLTPFIQTYLGVQGGLNDATQTTVTGTGTVFNALGVLSLAYPFSNYSDVITPSLSSEVAFLGNKGPAAVQKETTAYRTTFWGFPFESLPSSMDRKNALQAFLTWCDQPYASTPTPTPTLGHSLTPTVTPTPTLTPPVTATPTVTLTPRPIDPTSTPTPTTTSTALPGVWAKNAWVTDRSFALKDIFMPGDEILYVGNVENDTGITHTLTLDWLVDGPCGSIFEWSGDATIPADSLLIFGDTAYPIIVGDPHTPIIVEYTRVPIDACSGTYTFTFSVTFEGRITSQSSVFSVLANSFLPLLLR